MCYKVNDYAISLNNGAVVSDTSAVVPAGVTRLGIGSLDGLFDAAAQMGGTIKKLTYYPVRLPNAELQEMTA
jgi:hypothetical protein